MMITIERDHKTMMDITNMTDYERGYEAAKAEFERKKKSDSLWTKEKKKLRERLDGPFKRNVISKVTDAITVIAKVICERANITGFSPDDIETIDMIVSEIMDIAVKYNKQETERRNNRYERERA